MTSNPGETRFIRRGDVLTVDFEPIRGSEQGKIRPAVIIQNDTGNQYSPTVIVALLTSGQYARYAVNVEVKAPEGGVTRDSLVLLNQIRVIDKSRILHYWGHLSPATMRKVDEAIKISLGLVPVEPYAGFQQ